MDDLSWLILDNPEIAETAISYQWLSPGGTPTLDDRRAIRAIRATADVNPDLGATLWRNIRGSLRAPTGRNRRRSN